MATIRWGIIGCGDVAEVKSGPAFYKAADSKLVAVMRRNAALAADFARRHGVPRWSDDARAIIEAPDIDAVYIATWTDTHCDYVLECAAAGKAVYVEKPMARDHAECMRMIAACRAAQVPLWVAYYRRALPRFLKVRELVETGAIGTVRMAVTRQFARPPRLDASAMPWRVDPEHSSGGFFFDGVVHTLDFLDFLLGPIESVRAFAANQGGAYAAEDVVSASYRFASGVHGSGTWCYTAGFDEEYTEIIGAEGRIRFSITAPVPIVVQRSSKVEELPIGDPPHVQQPLVQSIVDELNGRGRCPSTGETAARTAWVMDEILREFRATGRSRS